MRRAPAVALLGLLVSFVAPARAADPIMPLSQVRSGMRCTGYSVVRGVDISTFDVEILDVVAASAGDPEPRILVRVSGPAVEPWGIAEGFSGSPVLCPGDDGTMRNVGALAYSVGQYGDSIGLATPIELILGESPDAPARARRDPALLRSARPLAGPLSIGGLNPALGRLVERAGRLAGRSVRATPGPPAGGVPPRPLRPGSSIVAAVATGDLSAGALGTVTYVDGDRVWAFGHPFDGAGARSLALQDAWIYTVVYNPIGIDPAVSYKLGAAGREIGTLNNDAFDAIAGRLGAGPNQIDVRVLGRDLDTGRRTGLTSRVADESALGNPGGATLPLVADLALAETDALALRSIPEDQSGALCARIQLAEREKPLRFCNRYVGGGSSDGDTGLGSGAVARMSSDIGRALGLVSSFQGTPLRIRRLGIDLRVRRGLDQAFLLGATGPSRVRAGTTVPVRLRLRTAAGVERTARTRISVPKGTKPGRYAVRLTGPAADTPEDSLTQVIVISLGGESTDNPATSKAPKTLDELAARVAGISRYDGVTVRLARTGRKGGTSIGVFRDTKLRLSGAVAVKLRVVP